MFALLKTGLSLFMGGNVLVRIGAYLLIGLISAGGVWLHGYMSGRAGADHKALVTKITRLETALKMAEKHLQEHEQQTSLDVRLDEKNKDLINATPENSLLCFDDQHIKRLRQLR